MRLDRVFRDLEPLGDLPIAMAARNLHQDVELALGERFVGQVFGQQRRDFWRHTLLAGMDVTDDLDEILRRHALQYVGFRSGREGALNIDVALERRQRDDARVWKVRTDRDGRVDAA